jgi:hypothetical protein
MDRYIKQASRQIRARQRTCVANISSTHSIPADLATVDLVRALGAIVLARDVIAADEDSDAG